MLIHIWNRCHGCETAPIIGIRHFCTSCPDGPENDLCVTCFQKYTKGELAHPPAHALGASGTGPHIFEACEGQPEENFKPWLDIPMAEGIAPKINPGLLVRPEFLSGYESTFAGYGFAARWQEKTLVLTALHVMDEMVRKKSLNLRSERVTGRELPDVITKVNLYDVLAQRWMLSDLGTAGPMLILPRARLGVPEPDSFADIAAFEASANLNLKPAELAEAPPQPGEPIWLATALPQQGHVQKAVVVASEDHGLIFRYQDLEEKVKYSSGAPLLNERGQVVALNVGGGWYKGHRFGHANHVGNIRIHLSDCG